MAKELATLQGADGGPKLGFTEVGAGADILSGQYGDDTLFGGAADDQIWGGPGNDTLLGGSGIDKLYGGEGHDRLGGGHGADVMNGGNGDDFYLVDNVLDVVSDASGTDTVILGANGAYTLSKVEIVATATTVTNATITVAAGGTGVAGVDLALMGSSSSTNLTLRYNGTAEIAVALFGGGGNDRFRLEGASADFGEFHFKDISAGDQIDLTAYDIDEKLASGVVDIRFSSFPSGTFLIADDVLSAITSLMHKETGSPELRMQTLFSALTTTGLLRKWQLAGQRSWQSFTGL